MALASALTEARLLARRGAFASLAAAPAAVSVSVAPLSETNLAGSSHTVVATVLNSLGAPVGGVDVTFHVAGVNPQSGVVPTLPDGTASFTWTGTNPGEDGVVAVVGASAVAAKTWEYSYLAEPECVAFYDGLDISKLTLGGSNVLAWANSLPGGDPLLTAGAASMTVGGVINGHSAIRGATAGSAGRLVAATTWVEALVVCVYGAATFSGSHSVLNADEDDNADRIALVGTSGGANWFTTGTGNAHYLNGAASAAAPMTNAGVCNVVRSLATTGVAVGCQGNLVNREWRTTSAVGDVVLFSAELGAVARARVVARAKTRWGIT